MLGEKPSRGTKKPPGIRLFLEELESRCLLSHQITPIGGITSAPDGSIWFLEQDRLGRVDQNTGVITEFAVGLQTANSVDPGFPGEPVAAGPDGSIWFFSNDEVARFNPNSSVVDKFALASGSLPMGKFAFSPDGKIWFLESRAHDWALGRIDPVTGSVQEFGMGQGLYHGRPSALNGLSIAPDGKIWAPAPNSSLDEFDPTTVAVREFPGSSDFSAGGYDGSMVEDSNGNLWFFESKAVQPFLREFNLATGQQRDFGVISPLSWTMAADRQGNIWFLEGEGAGFMSLAQFNPTTEKETLYQFSGGDQILQLTAGSDGGIWLVGEVNNAKYVSRFDPGTGALEKFNEATDAPSASPGNSAPAAGTSFNATAAIDFKGAVASFTPQTPIATPGVAYQVTVNWGDGTTSNLVLTVTANGTYNVVADHAYQTAGTFNVAVTIAPYTATSGLNADPVTVFSTANVSDNPMDFKPFP